MRVMRPHSPGYVQVCGKETPNAGQKHHAFATSSDIREVLDERMLIQKLKYVHANPVSGVWGLVPYALEYPHSSPAFYALEPEHAGPAPLVHYHRIIFGNGERR